MPQFQPYRIQYEHLVLEVSVSYDDNSITLSIVHPGQNIVTAARLMGEARIILNELAKKLGIPEGHDCNCGGGS